ncbi:unnamed protein product [Calicophoron daubneyi]
MAPRLKLDTIGKRQCLSGQKPPPYSNPLTVLERRGLAKISKECCKLLDALGVPWVQSPGEAEAMCAFLNSAQSVNACITNDGDAFLYGAPKVYRHFSMDDRDASVRVYCSDRVRTELHLTRPRLVLLGILLGCDYWPAGVKGFGPNNIRSLLSSIGSMTDDGLLALIAWMDENRPATEEAFRQMEIFKNMDPKNVRLWTRMGSALHNCPVQEIFTEFLASPHARCWSVPSGAQPFKWCRPDPCGIVNFCVSHLNWAADYALHHLLPVLALWDLRYPRVLPGCSNFAHPDRSSEVDSSLIPVRIVKRRTVNFVPSYEVEWKRMSFDKWTLKSGLSTGIQSSLRSSEEQTPELADVYSFAVPVVEFTRAHPDLCELFEQASIKPSKKTARKKKNTFSKNEMCATDGQLKLSDLFGRLHIDDPSKAISTISSHHLEDRTLPPSGSRSDRNMRIPRWDSEPELDSFLSQSPSRNSNPLRVSFPSTPDHVIRAESVQCLTNQSKNDGFSLRLRSAFISSPTHLSPLFARPGGNILQSSLLSTPPPLLQKVTSSDSDKFPTPPPLRERLTWFI